MAIQRNPNDPFRGDDTESLRRTDRKIDNELQTDPELAEGPAGGSRLALFAIAIIAVLGVVFYGLSSPTGTWTPTAQTTTPAPIANDTAATRPPVGQTTGSAVTPSSPSSTSPNPNATATDNGVQFSPPPSPTPNSGSTSGTAPAGTGPANN